MAKRRTKPTAIEASSGNVFADLGLPDAEKLKIKSGLVVEIARTARRLALTQKEAGRRMGVPQAKVLRLHRRLVCVLSARWAVGKEERTSRVTIQMTGWVRLRG